ncbi:uncharacterized protein PADG_02060 [Paracoccidioides brasiliensis Pb18]|uniref:Uncharacterized protein n=1 Tax=Paracoccidioides brasiliensis (strain Pb18) TaxID=502780 RepID=C1G544_PARBD|nr:uncharacterized protein PADG_02060 [Paracoccidioides brasiliensis Pb18]EEH45910.2 hypothetical protein PADG_02060 [Paracoccidioides brasiliensis Pb18]
MVFSSPEPVKLLYWCGYRVRLVTSDLFPRRCDADLDEEKTLDMVEFMMSDRRAPPIMQEYHKREYLLGIDIDLFHVATTPRGFKLRALKKLRLSQLIRPSSSSAAAISELPDIFLDIWHIQPTHCDGNIDLETPATGAAYQLLGTQCTDQSQELS